MEVEGKEMDGVGLRRKEMESETNNWMGRRRRKKKNKSGLRYKAVMNKTKKK